MKIKEKEIQAPIPHFPHISPSFLSFLTISLYGDFYRLYDCQISTVLNN